MFLSLHLHARFIIFLFFSIFQDLFCHHIFRLCGQQSCRTAYRYSAVDYKTLWCLPEYNPASVRWPARSKSWLNRLRKCTISYLLIHILSLCYNNSLPALKYFSTLPPLSLPSLTNNTIKVSSSPVASTNLLIMVSMAGSATTKALRNSTH
jgi:hypothetical protein